MATLPQPRQEMYDLFVRRALDSRKAATELRTDVVEVRRLRRENREGMLRAFEVTALIAAEAGLDPWSGEAAGAGSWGRCWPMPSATLRGAVGTRAAAGLGWRRAERAGYRGFAYPS